MAKQISQYKVREARISLDATEISVHIQLMAEDGDVQGEHILTVAVPTALQTDLINTVVGKLDAFTTSTGWTRQGA